MWSLCGKFAVVVAVLDGLKNALDVPLRLFEMRAEIQAKKIKNPHSTRIIIQAKINKYLSK